MLAIVISALFVTICEITTFNLLKSIVLIRICDLQKVGHGHELQPRRIRRWMDFSVAYKMLKKWWTPFILNHSPLVHQCDIHTYMSQR